MKFSLKTGVEENKEIKYFNRFVYGLSVAKFFDAIVNRKNLLDSKFLFGGATNFWEPENKMWVERMEERRFSIINPEQSITSIKRMLYFLVLCFRKFMSSKLMFVLNNFLFYRQKGVDIENIRKQKQIINYLRSIELAYIQHWLAGTFSNKKHCKARFEELFMNEKVQRKLLIDFFKHPTCVIFLGNLELSPIPSALNELREVCIPTIGIVDTHASVEGITYPVYGNDDSTMALIYFIKSIAMAVQYGKLQRSISLKNHFSVISKGVKGLKGEKKRKRI